MICWCMFWMMGKQTCIRLQDISWFFQTRQQKNVAISLRNGLMVWLTLVLRNITKVIINCDRDFYFLYVLHIITSINFDNKDSIYKSQLSRRGKKYQLLLILICHCRIQKIYWLITVSFLKSCCKKNLISQILFGQEV